jgi:MFS family permease
VLRAQAIGVWGAMIGLSMALGPVLGGALVDALSWRAVFFVNVPIGVAAIALTAWCVPESRAERPRRLDPVGQLLVIARNMSVDPATQRPTAPYSALQRPTALQGDTRRDTDETARLAETSQLAGRFRKLWQVLGSSQRWLSQG